jgi:hypothetical protein
MVSQQPSACEAVKAGEAAREAGCLYSFARRWQRTLANRGDVAALMNFDASIRFARRQHKAPP